MNHMILRFMNLYISDQILISKWIALKIDEYIFICALHARKRDADFTSHTFDRN